MRPEVSIIVPHYLGDILQDCLRQLTIVEAGANFEIIVVDDQPHSDGSLERARAAYPGIKFTATGGRAGFAAACNRGLALAEGEFVLFLNNDTLVTDGWLAPLVRLMYRCPDVAVCSPKILSARDHGAFDYSGAAGGLLDRYGFPFARGRVFGHVEKDKGQYDSCGDSFWVSGCAMLVRKSVLQKIGAFDESLYMQMEEIDLCWRARLHGHRISLCPDSVVFHYGGKSLPNGSFRKTYLNYRNNLSLLIKNLSAKNLCWVLPTRVVIQLATVILFFLEPREWRHLIASVGGLGAVGLRLPSLLRARRQVQKLRTRPDRDVLALGYRGSIVFSYFFRGRRTAEQLFSRSAPRRNKQTPFHGVALGLSGEPELLTFGLVESCGLAKQGLPGRSL